jgi:hypothetical protein
MGSIAAACLLAIAVSGWRSNGFPGRFGPTQKTNYQVVRAVAVERARAVRGDVCQFNNFTGIGIDGFLNQWHCQDDGALPHLRRIPVIITGDSHSADQVIALKLNGLLPLQIGGAGCSIVPSRMSASCERIFHKLYDAVGNDPYYQYLALARSFSESELTPEATREAVAYWKKFNKKLIWFSAMPTFYEFSAHLQRGRPPRADFKLSDLSQRDEINRILNDSAIHIVDSRRIFCSLNDCGYASGQGCVLLADDSHLSLWGAQLFGRALLDTDPLFSQWRGGAGAAPGPQDLKTCHKLAMGA